MSNSKCIVVTGGAGFIGSALVRNLIKNSDSRVVNIDKLTYAGNPQNLKDYETNTNYHFFKKDISNEKEIETKTSFMLILD